MARIEALITVLDRSKGRLAIALGAALLLHFPFTPLMGMLRLAHRLSGQVSASEPPPKAELVDVELREALRSEELRKEAKAQQAHKAASVQMEPPSNVKFASSAEPKPEPEEASATPKPAKKEKLKSVGLEGIDQKLLGKPQVTLGLWLSSLRENPLAERLAEVLACDREWKRFLDQGVDVMRDFDAMLVVGPSLFDSEHLTAAVHHTLSPERVQEVMRALVESSGERGSWLLPDVASARLGRRQRVLLPQSSDVFFVTPPKGWEALKKSTEPLRVPSAEGRTASLVLVNPNRALSRVGLTLPKRIREMRLEVFANSDGSVDLKLELEAESSEAARDEEKRVAAQISEFFSDAWIAASALRAISGSASEETHLETAPRLDLEVDEQVLSGVAHLSPHQAQATVNLLAELGCRKKPAKPRAK